MRPSQYAVAISTLLLSGSAICQSVAEFDARYLASVSTQEGKVYEMLATAEFRQDLGFMPECAARAGVNSGAITIYYEVNTSGVISDLYMAPYSILTKCIQPLLLGREFTAPPSLWVGKITLTISQ